MKNKGVFLGLIAAFCFALMNVLIKITATEFEAAQVMFARGIVGIIILTPFIIKEIPKLFNKTTGLLWLRFFSGAGSIFFLFYNVQVSGAGVGTALGKIEAIFVIILSLFLFKEYPKVSDWIGITCILLGVGALHLPVIKDVHFESLWIGLTGAFLGGIALTALKKIVSSFSPILIVWGLCFTTIIVSLFIPSDPWFLKDTRSTLPLLATGLLGVLGQVLLTKSYAALQAPIASVVNLSSILWCLILESFYFQITPSPLILCSYGLIIFGLVGLQLNGFQNKIIKKLRPKRSDLN